MSGVNVLIFTDSAHSRMEKMSLYLRGAGAYRIATEIRNAGYTCQVIDFFSLLDYEFIENVIEKFVDDNTHVIAFGNTFWERSDDEGFNKRVDAKQYLKNRTHIRLNMNMNLTESGKSIFPFSDDLIEAHIINKAKSKNPKIKFVMGGPNLFGPPHKFIDCNIHGFSDMSIVHYLNNIVMNFPLRQSYNEDDNKEFDFNNSRITWERSDVIFENEALPIEISRGCIFDCKFCSFHLRGKNKFDYIKNPEVLREEFIRNYELYGITRYSFAEDTFNDSTHKLETLYNNVISKLPFKIRFGAFLRLDLLNAHREQIDLLKDMGIRTGIFGIESITPQSLKIIGKSIQFDTMCNITSIINDKWKNSATTMASLIFGLPGDTPDSLKRYEQWIADDVLNHFSSAFVIPFQMHKHGLSFIAKNYEQYGFSFGQSDHDWINKDSGLDFQTAIKTASSLRRKIINDDRYRFSGHLCLSGPSFGISDDVALNTSIKDIDMQATADILINKVESYKSKVLAI